MFFNSFNCEYGKCADHDVYEDEYWDDDDDGDEDDDDDDDGDGDGVDGDGNGDDNEQFVLSSTLFQSKQRAASHENYV